MGFADDVGKRITASTGVIAVHIARTDGLVVGVGKQHFAVPGYLCLVPAAHEEAVEVELLKQVQGLAYRIIAEKRGGMGRGREIDSPYRLRFFGEFVGLESIFLEGHTVFRYYLHRQR